jgi:hypothetical protein
MTLLQTESMVEGDHGRRNAEVKGKPEPSTMSDED